MAKKIDNVKVKAGRVIEVQNTKRPVFSNAKKTYLSVWVEDPNGDNERCLLFTEREIRVAERRAKRNSEDIPDKGFITDLID